MYNKFYHEFSVTANNVISELFHTQKTESIEIFIRKVLERTQIEPHLVLSTLVLLYRLKMRLVGLVFISCHIG